MSKPAHKLPPDKTAAALSAINAWQRDTAKAVSCPMCGSEGLRIVDRSSRPYTAWFGLDCDACGLADHITYPLGGAGGSWS